MPTADEFQELIDNCTSVWTTLNGVNGRLFTSKVNGNTLFFPAAGNYNGRSLNRRGSGGNYWTSTYDSAMNALSLNFNNSSADPQYSGNRRYGFSVRAVQDGTPNRSVVPHKPEDEPKNEGTTTLE